MKGAPKTELKEMRRSQGKSQESVAEAAKISRAAYSNIENGKRRPSPEVAMRIGAYLDFPWTKFFEDSKKEGEPA